jgi:hypothetical protein
VNSRRLADKTLRGSDFEKALTHLPPGALLGEGGHYNEPMTKILYRVHAVQRMFERDISLTKVRKALETGDVIEDYSDETPEPSRLMMGFQGKRPFHVVASENPSNNEMTVVTVYLPDASKWKKDFRSRR